MVDVPLVISLLPLLGSVPVFCLGAASKYAEARAALGKRKHLMSSSASMLSFDSIAHPNSGMNG